MNQNEKIQLLRISLINLKAGNYISLNNLRKALSKKEHLMLGDVWYSEKPFVNIEIIKPQAVNEYQKLLKTAESIRSRRIVRDLEIDWPINEDPIRDSEDLYERELTEFNIAIDFWLTERKKDPNFHLWFDYEGSKEICYPSNMPKQIGVDDCFRADNMGYSLCPSEASLTTKVAALEIALENICDGYENKILESCMT